MMKLFGAPVSPFVRKVLAYAAEKGVALELVPISLGDPNPEFIECSPFKKMPAFKDGDFSISDSSAIITYLEAKHPEHPMLPADPADRARVIWFEEFADSMLSAALGTIFFNMVVKPKFMQQEPDLEAVDNAKTTLVPPVCDYLERVIPASGFLVGDALTLADIAVASPFVNAAHSGYVPDAAAYPKLTAYLAAMHARPSMGDWIRRERKMLGLT
jgi:glutathione S-transferase